MVSENESGTPVFSVPNIFVREYLLSNYQEPLKRFFGNPEGEINIVFEVAPEKYQPKKLVSHEQYQFENSETRFFKTVWKKYQQAKFDDAKFIHPELISLGREWAKKPTSVFVFGGIGCGKTYFAFCLIREAFKRMEISSPLYYSCTELDSLMLDAIKSDGGDYELIKKIKQANFLFLDDFGRETRSDRIARQFYEIINYRYSNELPTLITSNLNLDQIGEKMDCAIASRIQEWEIIHIGGDDIRKKI